MKQLWYVCAEICRNSGVAIKSSQLNKQGKRKEVNKAVLVQVHERR